MLVYNIRNEVWREICTGWVKCHFALHSWMNECDKNENSVQMLAVIVVTRISSRICSTVGELTYCNIHYYTYDNDEQCGACECPDETIINLQPASTHSIHTWHDRPPQSSIRRWSLLWRCSVIDYNPLNCMIVSVYVTADGTAHSLSISSIIFGPGGAFGTPILGKARS